MLPHANFAYFLYLSLNGNFRKVKSHPYSEWLVEIYARN